MTISARRTLLILVFVNLVLMTLHLLWHLADLTYDLSPLLRNIGSRFDMDRESSIPTCFAQALLLSCAVLSWMIGRAKKKLREPFARHWMLLAALFAYMSVDEGAELHELAIEPMQELFGITGGPFFFAWFIPAVAVLALLTLVLLRFILALPGSTRRLFILAALVFLTGAVGFEMISGAHWSASGFVYDMQCRFYNAMEEGLENFGTTIGIYALLRYLATISREGLPSLRFAK